MLQVSTLTPTNVAELADAVRSSPRVIAVGAGTKPRLSAVSAVKISTTHDNSGFDAAKKTAEAVIDSAYGYSLGPVLFKPTLTVTPQTFRTTREGALAYFVGGNPTFAKDTGFALKHWRKYEIQNAALFMDGDVAISMGNVRLTDRDGNVTVVDKTWGWKRGTDGNLRIVLHHSSLPYNPG